MPEFRGGRFGGGGGRGRGGRGGGGGRFRDIPEGPFDPEEEKFRKLFIGGLSYETSDKTLKEYYEKWGEVVDVVVMKDPATKRSRGFGFVTFGQSAQVDDAQENRPHTIDGREVECKRAMPRDGNESQELIKKLFCGGLPADITEEALAEYFGPYGNLLKVDVIKDKETQRCKGFAFLEFDDYDPVDKCVLKKRHKVGGKMIDVSKALPKDKEGGGGGGGRRGGKMGDGGYGQQSGGYGGSGYSQSGYGGSGGGYGGSSGGYGGSSSGYGGQSSGYGGSSGGYGGSSGGYGSQSSGYASQSSGYGGGEDYGYSSMGSGYSDSYGGGPMRGSSYSQRGSGPYGGGYGSGSYSQGGSSSRGGGGGGGGGW